MTLKEFIRYSSRQTVFWVPGCCVRKDIYWWWIRFHEAPGAWIVERSLSTNFQIQTHASQRKPTRVSFMVSTDLKYYCRLSHLLCRLKTECIGLFLFYCHCASSLDLLPVSPNADDNQSTIASSSVTMPMGFQLSLLLCFLTLLLSNSQSLMMLEESSSPCGRGSKSSSSECNGVR